MRQRATLHQHVEFSAIGEIAQSKPSRWVFLGEIELTFTTMNGTPLS